MKEKKFTAEGKKTTMQVRSVHTSLSATTMMIEILGRISDIGQIYFIPKIMGQSLIKEREHSSLTVHKEANKNTTWIYVYNFNPDALSCKAKT